MTYTNTDDYRNTRNALDDLEKNVDLNVIPPQNLNPDGTSANIFTNPNTGATYKFIAYTPKKLHGQDIPTERKQRKNSWVFYPPDAEIGIEIFDPSQGNLWVDDDDTYIVYVYNNGEIIDKPYGNKTYDHTNKLRY
mgnify:CR=1 FL=1